MKGKKKEQLTDYFASKETTDKPAKGKANAKKGKGDMEEEEKTAAVTSLNSSFPPFDDFVEGLCSWKDSLSKITSGPVFKGIYTYVKNEYATRTCYPPPELIFNAFKLTAITNIKVVIVGQDPYHQPGQAMGLCFSVPKGITPPPSLVNIFKCIEADPNIKNFKRPNHGDLTKWATQGVFLLNDLLTVVNSTPEAHKASGWKKFTDEVINVINRDCEGVVFMLWGKPAQTKGKIINKSKHFILETSHPSPLSASRGFLTSNHFSEVNKLLAKNGKAQIDWNLDQFTRQQKKASHGVGGA